MSLDLRIHPSYKQVKYKKRKLGFEGKNQYLQSELTKNVIEDITTMLEMPYGTDNKKETLEKLGEIEPAEVVFTDLVPLVQYKTLSITKEELARINHSTSFIGLEVDTGYQYHLRSLPSDIIFYKRSEAA